MHPLSAPRPKDAPQEDPRRPLRDVVLNYDPPLELWDAQGLARAGCRRVFEEATGAVDRVVCPFEPSDEQILDAIEADRKFRAARAATLGR